MEGKGSDACVMHDERDVNDWQVPKGHKQSTPVFTSFCSCQAVASTRAQTFSRYAGRISATPSYRTKAAGYQNAPLVSALGRLIVAQLLHPPKEQRVRGQTGRSWLPFACSCAAARTSILVLTLRQPLASIFENLQHELNFHLVLLRETKRVLSEGQASRRRT